MSRGIQCAVCDEFPKLVAAPAAGLYSTAVRIREAEVHTLAAAIVNALLKQGFVRPKREAAALQKRIVELLVHNLEEEQAIEEEAERLAEVHARKMVGMDHRKIIQGLKERLARERGFSL
jgi:hypothetical protein